MLLVMVMALLLGCVGTSEWQARGSAGVIAREPEPSGVERGVGRSGSLLDGLRGRVPNLEVRDVPGGCPELVFRGRGTLVSDNSPAIYVDGTRMVDTCILQELQAREVESVRVFAGPAGLPGGLRAGAAGAIVIELRGTAGFG